MCCRCVFVSACVFSRWNYEIAYMRSHIWTTSNFACYVGLSVCIYLYCVSVVLCYVSCVSAHVEFNMCVWVWVCLFVLRWCTWHLDTIFFSSRKCQCDRKSHVRDTLQKTNDERERAPLRTIVFVRACVLLRCGGVNEHDTRNHHTILYRAKVNICGESFRSVKTSQRNENENE
jgi:hypothetical protein